MKTWSCKIGEVDAAKLPPGADAPMRKAVQAAYRELTGQDPEFLFSGWGAELTADERAVAENRLPHTEVTLDANAMTADAAMETFAPGKSYALPDDAGNCAHVRQFIRAGIKLRKLVNLLLDKLQSTQGAGGGG